MQESVHFGHLDRICIRTILSPREAVAAGLGGVEGALRALKAGGSIRVDTESVATVAAERDCRRESTQGRSKNKKKRHESHTEEECINGQLCARPLPLAPQGRMSREMRHRLKSRQPELEFVAPACHNRRWQGMELPTGNGAKIERRPPSPSS